MRIFEEYFQRHKIIDVPLVHHCSNGTLLLEADKQNPDWNSRWVLLTIKWVEDNHHPGEYLIELQTPNHDCINKFFTTTQVTKKWQEYEDFILQWGSSLDGLRPITNSREILITAWEMFIFMYDSWFTKQPATLKNKLFQSLDKENTLETRYSNYQDVAIFLATHHPAVMRIWKYEVLARVQNCANWLAHLIENKYEPKQEKLLQKTIGSEEPF